MSDLEVKRFNRAAISASLLVQPRDHGLTVQELIAIGERHGQQPGEVLDALNDDGSLKEAYHLGEKLMATGIFSIMLLSDALGSSILPSAACLDFVVAQFKAQAAQVQWANAALESHTIASRAETAKHTAHDAEVALALFVGLRILKVENGVFRVIRPMTDPSFATREKSPRPEFVALLTKLIPTVRDILARRAGVLPSHPEPLRTFADELERLGFPHLRQWWDQIRGELSRADEQLSTVTCILLSAALGEAALTCVARKAEATGVTMTGLPPDTRQWKFDTLIRQAKSGAGAILDGQLGARCADLNEKRQRIHIARFLNATPAAVDYKVEEAREAKQTVDRLVRAVLDWMDRHLSKPPP